MKTITNEIKSLDPDIVCIQEANIENYKKFFLTNFKEYNFHYTENYGSNFINLTGYKKEKYQLIEQKGINLNDIDVNGNRGVFYVKLRNKTTNTIFSVYNVHFPWRPIYEIEKCYVLNAIIENIIKDDNKNVIIAGDFNSIPNSMVLRLIYYPELLNELNLYTSGKDDVLKSFELIKNDNTIRNTRALRRKAERYILENCIKTIFKKDGHLKRFPIILNNMQIVSRRFGFRSSYEYHQEGLSNENRFFLDYINTHPKYTNYTEGFRNTIDYIFHSNSLKVWKILKVPDELEVTREDYLPSSKYPSDHLKLYTQFVIV
jgi:mRNA deadenylase 3'-5' endonuclease subunit Ccr4